jgi:hypothetical protein
MSVVHCMEEPYDIYIGGGHDPQSGEPGRWAGPAPTVPCGGRDEQMARYADWLREELDAERIGLEELAALDGKALGYLHRSEACHGEVLERASDWAARMVASGPNMFWDLRPSKRGGRFEPLVGPRSSHRRRAGR